MDGLGHDLRLALRLLTRGGIVPLLVVLCLALGIGLNAASFTLLRGAIYGDLGVREADRVVWIQSTSPVRGEDLDEVTAADLSAVRESGMVESAELIEGRNTTLTEGDAEGLSGFAVSPGLFSMMGVDAQLGRGFVAADAGDPGLESAALVSDALWRRRFAGDPALVGSTIHLNGRAVQVVGIMPTGFRFPESADLWVAVRPPDPNDATRRSLVGLARLTPGVTLDEARARARDLSERLATERPETHRDYQLVIDDLRERMVEGARGLYLMMGAVVLVLLIACLNAANLLLARAGDRSRDAAVRAALGASRGRLIRQALVEALVLSAAAAWIGWLFAGWFVQATVRRVPEELPYWMDFEPSGLALAFTTLLAVATALLFGSIPALRSSRPDLSSRMGGRGRVDGPGRLLAGIVGVEVALSLVLLVGAGLLARSSLLITGADIGIPVEGTLSLRLPLSTLRYAAVSDRVAFLRALTERLEASPAVRGAVVVTAIPADDGGQSVRVRATAAEPFAEAPLAVAVGWTGRGPGEVGGRLIAGRELTSAEAMDAAASVALVGERLARRLWPAGDPLGRTLVVDSTELRVVGVVGDMTYEELGEETSVSRLQVHVPYARLPYRTVALLVRGTGRDAGALMPIVRTELHALDPMMAPYEILGMEDRRRFTRWENELLGSLFTDLGAVALLLAAAGIYGVVAYGVTRRRRELGVRLVLGARPGALLSGVVRSTATPAALGAGAGLGAAFALSRLMSGLLYGVSPGDPITFSAASAAMLLVAVAAALVPARRALKLNPADALRSE